MSLPNTIFLGTPALAVPSLARLLEISAVKAVITRPDRARGRSKRPKPSPVKEAARAAGVEVYEAGLGSEICGSWFEAIDLAVVVAFGVLIPSPILPVPRLGFLNVHFSLLPRWRGASPVAAALMAGDEETGVSLMELDAGLDTGPVIAALTTPIGAEENGGDLTDRLALMGADLLATTMPNYLAGQVAAVKQSDAATYAPRLGKEDLRIELTADPLSIYRKVKALAPTPALRLDTDSGPVKLLAVRPAPEVLDRGTLALVDDRLFLGLQQGSVELVEVQPPGRRAMSGQDWARGWHEPPTAKLNPGRA